jgi:hypothetical protein
LGKLFVSTKKSVFPFHISLCAMEMWLFFEVDTRKLAGK